MNVTAIRQLDKRSSALALLFLGLCAHSLFYIRSIIFAPELYLGPSGADRVFYYAYTRSLVIDHDLDFQNDLALKAPSSGMVLIEGKPHNKYPIGMPLLSLPFYAGAHLVLNSDGYSKPYVVAFSLGQMTWCIVGFILLYLTLLRYFDPQLSSLATVGAMFGTPLLRFTGADLMMSHAAAFFSLTWCFFEASRLQSNENPWRWFRLGAASMLTVIVRLQNGVFLLVPLVSIARAIIRLRSGAIIPIAAAVAGALLVLTPQSIVWRVTGGSWISNSYADEMSFAWLEPKIGPALSLLTPWWPMLAIVICGGVIAGLRFREPLILASLAAMIGNFYVSASWWSWEVAGRATFENLPIVAIAIAQITEMVPGLWLRFAFIGMITLWSAPIVFGGYEVSEHLVTAWLSGLRLLV